MTDGSFCIYYYVHFEQNYTRDNNKSIIHPLICYKNLCQSAEYLSHTTGDQSNQNRFRLSKDRFHGNKCLK